MPCILPPHKTAVYGLCKESHVDLCKLCTRSSNYKLVPAWQNGTISRMPVLRTEASWGRETMVLVMKQLISRTRPLFIRLSKYRRSLTTLPVSLCLVSALVQPRCVVSPPSRLSFLPQPLSSQPGATRTMGKTMSSIPTQTSW